jgi:hypothetical protein
LGSLGTQFARGSKDAAGGRRRKSAATQGGLIRPKKNRAAQVRAQKYGFFGPKEDRADKNRNCLGWCEKMGSK